MAQSGNYDYNAPSINASSVGSQNVNGQNVGGYQMPDYTGIAKTNNANSQLFNAGQQGTIGAFQGAQQAAVNALPTYQQLSDTNNARYNVPGLMQNSTNLNNQMLRLPSENYGMTQGSDTNQAQLDQMTGVQQFRLSPQANAAAANANTALTLSNQATGYGIQNEAFQTSPYTTAAPMVQSALASAATNFTQAQSDELNALVSAVNAGTQLSGTQMAQLASLQNAKYVYDAAVNTANATQNVAKTNANVLQNVQPGSIMYNPATGKNTPV